MTERTRVPTNTDGAEEGDVRTEASTRREVKLSKGVTLTTDQPLLTHDEWLDEGRRRFGEDMAAWAFVCPNCGARSTVEDFAAVKAGTAGRECIGRHLDGRGCDWAAYGLLGTKGKGVLVEMPSGVIYEAFAFAETSDG